MAEKNGSIVSHASELAGFLNEENVRRLKPEQTLREIADNPLGFTPEQMNAIIQALTRNLGAQKEQSVAIAKQSTAGAPAAVRRGAVAKTEKGIGDIFGKALGGVTAGGADRQFKALQALMQAILTREEFELEREKSTPTISSPYLADWLNLALVLVA